MHRLDPPTDNESEQVESDRLGHVPAGNQQRGGIVQAARHEEIHNTDDLMRNLEQAQNKGTKLKTESFDAYNPFPKNQTSNGQDYDEEDEYGEDEEEEEEELETDQK